MNLEALADLDSQKILMMAGAALGTLFVLNIGAFSSGFWHMCKLIWRASKTAEQFESGIAENKKDLDEAHGKLRSLDQELARLANELRAMKDFLEEDCDGE